MITTMVCLLLVQASPEAKPTMKAVPRRIVAESLTTPAGVIKPGSSLAEVMTVLGSTAKASKVKKESAEHLLSMGRLVISMDSMAGAPLMGLSRSGRDPVEERIETRQMYDELAKRCEICDAQSVELKVGKNERISVLLMGPVGAGNLTAQVVIYGRERSKPAAWSQSGDGSLETVTEDGARLELRGGRDLFLSAK